MNKALEIVRMALTRCRVPLPVPLPVPAPRTRMPRVILAAALAISAVAIASASAHATPSRSQVDGNLVDVQVQVDGWPAPLFVRPGAWDKSYFQAFRGRSYSLVVTNQTNERVGVLIAVDGLNVVNGQRTGLDNHEAMYVLDPYESANIQGWRTSLRDVRRFVFVDEERSYASRTDQANGDMGWIRVLSFREQPQRITWRDDRPWIRGGNEMNAPRERDSQDGARREVAPAPPASGGDLRAQKSGKPMMQAPQSDAAPGTGWGDQRSDPVHETQFLAMATPTDRITLRYEYESGLRALGIIPRERRVWQRERGEVGLAQPPRW